MGAQLWDASVVSLGVTGRYRSTAVPLVAGKLVFARVGATVGGLAFYNEMNGTFAAAESSTGRDFSHLQTSPQRRNVEPLIELTRGWQYFAIAVGPNSALFSLAWCPSRTDMRAGSERSTDSDDLPERASPELLGCAQELSCARRGKHGAYRERVEPSPRPTLRQSFQAVGSGFYL